MSRWFRHYVGMSRDEKLVRAAVKARQSVERTIWVYSAILESASEINDGGRYEIGAAEMAYFLRCEEADIEAIVTALSDLGRIFDGAVGQWAERQYESDGSKVRQQRYRDKLKASRDPEPTSPSHGRDVTAPSHDRRVTPQETDTDSKTELESQHLAQIPKTRAELDLLETLCRKAGGLETSPSPGLLGMAPIMGLLKAGHDLELDVLPTIRAVSAKAKRKPGTWDYFVEAIKEASATRRGLEAAGLSPAIAPTGRPDDNIFTQMQREILNGSAQIGGGHGGIIDAVPRLSDLRQGGDERDGDDVSDGDRGLHVARIA